jgi:MSHA biogenesis protein MshM
MSKLGNYGVARRGTIYLKHFNFQKVPFTLTPNTEAFFDGGDRGTTLEGLEYACMHTDGIITVTGEVGTGKTMLSRMLIDRKPKNLEVVYVANPAVMRDEVVPLIASELRMRNLKSLRPTEVLRNLQNRLIDLHSKGKRVLLLIDEAHVMSAETLEEIRLLSNLETKHHKLLCIMLVGQDELNRTLAGPQMRPLRERITERFHLAPLSIEEVNRYLAFRLQMTGGRQDLFKAQAVLALARASCGIARRVNILAEKSILAAYSSDCQQVDILHVRAAIGEARFSPLGSGRITWLTSLAALGRCCSHWWNRLRHDSRSFLSYRALW